MLLGEIHKRHLQDFTNFWTPPPTLYAGVLFFLIPLPHSSGCLLSMAPSKNFQVYQKKNSFQHEDFQKNFGCQM